jgi:NitT/TauT family transport system substrate-binding protein
MNKLALRATLAACVILCVAPSLAADKVTIAYIGGTADVGFYIADAKGFLKDEGIEANFVVFDSSARMVAPLATGEVDVASGAVGAGTYNALERGIKLRAVADKARNKGVYSYQGLIVRKALYDSGKVRSLKDIKGLKFAMTAPGSNESAVLAEALGSVGLKPADMDLTQLSMPQQVAAYASGAIDVSFLPEPFLTAAIKAGNAVQLAPVSTIRDDDVTGVIVYSDQLVTKKPDLARRITKAYIRGLRVYVDALKNARLAGPGAEEVIDIIAKYSSVKDKAVLREIIPHYVDPDGRVGAESLKKDWAYFRSQGLIKDEIRVDQLIDNRWVDEAVKELGPYKPKS